MRYNWTSPALLFGLLVEFMDIIMMRKCLLGIKRRAERARVSGQALEPIRTTESGITGSDDPSVQLLMGEPNHSLT
jgi:hypothetical protein